MNTTDDDHKGPEDEAAPGEDAQDKEAGEDRDQEAAGEDARSEGAAQSEGASKADGEARAGGEGEVAEAIEFIPEKVAVEATEIVETILSHFPKIESAEVTWRIEDESIWIDVAGDTSGRLIGRRGQTIDAFQHIVSKIISHRYRKKATINVDAENYKKRQREKLIELAVQTADYVAETKEPRALESMSPADRRIIHITLREREDVITASEGRDPSRFVVIWPNEEE